MKRVNTREEIKVAKMEHEASMLNPKRHNIGRMKIVDAIMRSKVPHMNIKVNILRA